MRNEPRLDWNDILGGMLLFLSILGLLGLPSAREWIPAPGSGGGVVGHVLAQWLVVRLQLRFLGGLFLLLLAALVGSMLAFDVRVRHLVAVFRAVGGGIAWLTQRLYRRRSPVIRVAPEPAPHRVRRERERKEEEGEEGEEEEAPLPRIIGRRETQGGPISMAARPAGEWRLPPLDLLEVAGSAEVSQAEIRRQARVIEETLASFNVQARVVEVNCGPTVTQFALQPGTGVKVSRITSLASDLALALSAPSIRIEAPVPGRPVIGIEIPNPAISLVTLREILESPTFQEHRGPLKIALGRDVSGQPVVDDLTKMPHLLIAGTTGSGKSVCINAIIVSFLYQHSPETLRLIMIDPKRVELSIFQDIPHLAFPVVTEINGRRSGTPLEAGEVDALKVLYWATQEMERRYRVFAREGFRNITGYNKAARAEANPNLPVMPFIVLVIDELADLMMVAPEEVETMICRLAQLARATGIHLVLATQRPSVDVVTGLIKANFPSRISFAVSSSVDSRVVLDMVGAEQLLGRGDMLYMAPDAPKPVRIQGSYVSDEEIERVVAFWKEQRPEEPPPVSPVQLGMPLAWREEKEEEPEDELLPEAIALVRKRRRASAALLQRRLRVSYNRAARLIELLERKGIVGPEEQGRSREVYLPPEDDLE
jgi:S-DNA-T family DNA segregation ATPase FtsK/SpoIIIE